MAKITIPTSFKSEKYPDFIRNSIFLKAYPKPEKVFPRIGLKNCKIKLSSLKLDQKIVYEQYLNNILEVLADTSIKDDEYADEYADDILEISGYADNVICDGDTSEIEVVEKNGKMLAVVEKNWKFDKLKLNKDRDFFALLDQIKPVIYPEDKKRLESIKLNSSIKIGDNKDLYICFSSDGNQGYWDLATMSMRGVSSCMNWKSDNAKSLVGTIADPYAGIIYLTDGTQTKYGNKILARSVVRFVVKDNSKQTPALLFERLYVASGMSASEETQSQIETIFKSFINQKTNNKIEIANYREDDRDYGNDIGYVIPIAGCIDDMTDMYNFNDRYDDEPEYMSYRDSGINYETIEKYSDPKKVKIKI